MSTYDIEKEKVVNYPGGFFERDLDKCSQTFGQGECSTPSYHDVFSIGSATKYGTELALPSAEDNRFVSINADGTKLWLYESTANAIVEYNITDGDPSTAVATGDTLSSPVSASYTTQATITSDGLYALFTSITNKRVYQYELNTPGTLADGATFVGDTGDMYALYTFAPKCADIVYRDGAYYLYAFGDDFPGYKLKYYPLTSALVSTISAPPSRTWPSLSSTYTSMLAFQSGDTLLMIESSGDTADVHSVSDDGAIVSLTLTSSLGLTGEMSAPYGATFSPLGEYLYVVGQGPDSAVRYATPITQEPCYNTRNTCRYPLAYTQGTRRTDRYHVATPLVKGVDVDSHPLVVPGSISITPTRLQVGKGLSSRATFSIKLRDMTHNDVGEDDYLDQRTHDTSQGTYWGKKLARNKYYTGRPARWVEGYYTQPFTWDTFKTHEYVQDKVERLRDGSVKITCKDRLRKLDDAMVPPPSSTTLLADMTDTATSLMLDNISADQFPTYDAAGNYDPIPLTSGKLTLYDADGTPFEITASDGAITLYDADGTPFVVPLGDETYVVGESVVAYIGSELMRGTVSDYNVISSITRGIENTPVAAHAAGDTVQWCLELDNVTPIVALETVLPYAGITADMLNTTGWAAQEKWVSLMRISRILYEPEKVRDVVARITEQCSLLIWDDERSQLIELLAIAPQGESTTLSVVSDVDGLVADTLDIKEDFSDQATRALVHYNMISATGGTDKDNMSGHYGDLDAAAEGPDQWDRSRTKEINADFVRDGGTAATVSNRYIARLRDGVMTATFKLDGKDSGLWVGDEFLLECDRGQDEFGARDSIRMLVTSVKPEGDGTFSYEAEKSVYQSSRYAMIAPANHPKYSEATEADKAYAYICDANGYMPDGTEGYKII